MKDTNKIKSIVEETLKLMGIPFESVEESENSGTGTPKFVIKTDDSALLIGTRGAHLLAFNHLIKKMATRGTEDDEGVTRFFVDVNNYQEKLEDELKNKARVMSERARSFKADIEMEPMSSYERMIVHAFLQNMADIKTESKGEGRDRRVVIKYVDTSANAIN